jgi:hypothetical protein
MIHKGDKVRVVNLDDWNDIYDHPEFFLGKEGIVVAEGSFIETTIKDMYGNNTLFLEEELELVHPRLDWS